ncbi:MAG: FAD-dependent monooxygenase [archaeon]|jgi:flavin-dependent dehydrogenase
MIVKDLDSLELGFDIVIVGAGAAGCTLAANLSEKFKVLLVDSKDFPRKKACSGILVTEGKDFFGSTLDKRVLVEPKNLDITYVDWNNGSEKVSKKGFWNTDRFMLDNFLFDKVRNKSNVYFLKNTTFVEYTATHDGVHKVVMLEANGLVKPIIAKYLVGCDGALSRVRKKLDSHEIQFYIGIQEFIRSSIPVDNAYFIFDNELTDFYAWIIPKKPFIEIGALLDPKDSKEKFLLLKKKISEKFGITGEGIMNSSIVLRPSSSRDLFLGRDSVLLCGEAAGLISPSSAEGISYALRSGKYCADALNSSSDPLKEYSKNCKDLLSRIVEKFEKSRVLSDKNKRKRLFS